MRSQLPCGSRMCLPGYPKVLSIPRRLLSSVDSTTRIHRRGSMPFAFETSCLPSPHLISTFSGRPYATLAGKEAFMILQALSLLECHLPKWYSAQRLGVTTSSVEVLIKSSTKRYPKKHRAIALPRLLEASKSSFSFCIHTVTL